MVTTGLNGDSEVLRAWMADSQTAPADLGAITAGTDYVIGKEGFESHAMHDKVAIRQIRLDVDLGQDGRTASSCSLVTSWPTKTGRLAQLGLAKPKSDGYEGTCD
jgi:hypothetical protein